SPVKVQAITDGTSHTVMMGEKFHSDPFFDSWTSGNSGMKMYQVSAWGWVGGMKGAAHVFCSSAVPINSSMRAFTTSTNDISSQDRSYNAWGSGHPGIVCFLLSDGSTRTINDTINTAVFTALSTRA